MKVLVLRATGGTGRLTVRDALLIRFQPVASDIREVVSAMKVSSQLERIADKSVSIARRAKHLTNRPAVPEVALLEPSYRLALTIFHDSVRAFADGDDELARTLKLKDRELDALINEVTEKFARASHSQIRARAKLRGPYLHFSRPRTDRGSRDQHR